LLEPFDYWMTAGTALFLAKAGIFGLSPGDSGFNYDHCYKFESK